MRLNYKYYVLAGIVAATVLVGQPSGRAASTVVTGGKVDWGIKASLRNYIVGPIARGAVQAGDGASGTGPFQFPVKGATADPAVPSASVKMGGSVRFTGHEGKLDLKMSDFSISISGSQGTLSATINTLSSGVDPFNPSPPPAPAPTPSPKVFTGIVLANLSLGPPVVSENTIAWVDVAVSLTPAGVEPFGGFYSPGEILDPMTISLSLAAPATDSAAGTTTTRRATTTTTASRSSTTLINPSPSAASSTVATTTSRAPAAAPSSLPATSTAAGAPVTTPAATGGAVTSAGINKSLVEVGEQATVTGAGFQAGEQVEVHLHSEPIFVGVDTADAQGTVSHTFTVPQMPPGIHRAEIRGISSGRKLFSPEFTVAAAAAAGPVAQADGSSSLAITGAADQLILGAGILLILLGIMIRPGRAGAGSPRQ
ncbi:MAG: HtaA domain-containing protein [Actinomycetota bacterium]